MLLNALADSEHIVLGIQVDLQGGLVRRAVRPGFENDEADAEVVSFVHFAVHNKVVYLGVLQRGLVVSGDQHAHMGHAVPLPPLLADKGFDDILVHIVTGPVLGVKSLGHDVGQRLHDGRQSLDAGSVRSHVRFLVLS